LKTHHSFLAICLTASVLAFHGTSWAAPATTTGTETSESLDPVDGISGIYSDMEMRMRLAAKPNAQACSGDACLSNQQFDVRVQVIGEHLTKSAHEIYPEIKKKVPNFVFSVVDKQVLGSASNASGAVVIFRGIQHLDLGDEALTFIVGREMGHVIASHHKSNAKTRLLISALAAVLFPAVGILSASSAATQATTATSLFTSAASTATSIVGSEVAMSKIKPGQLTEADDVAISILEHSGLNPQEIAQSLEFIVEKENSAGWEKDLNQSTHYVRQLAGEPEEVVAEFEPLPEEYFDEETSVEMLALDERDDEPLVAIPEFVAHAEFLQKPIEEKTIEPHKVILITNQSLAESHSQARIVEDKSVTRAIAKKRFDKKSKVVKVKSKRGAKADATKVKKLKIKSSKKSTSIKPPAKPKAAKSKALVQSKR